MSDTLSSYGTLTASTATGGSPERLNAGKEPPSITLLALVNTLLRRWRLIAGVISVIVVLATLPSIWRRSFIAESVFTPQGAQEVDSRIAGIVSAFGVSLSTGAEGDTPDFYAELPTSHELLRELAMTQFRFATRENPTDTVRGTLIDLLDVRGKTIQERLSRTLALLKRRVNASADPKTGSVTLQVTAPSPELAELMNRRILDLISDFNIRRRQSQAAAERRFAEARMREARRGLDSAEAALESFLEQNRQYQGSPRLAFEQARLQRRIDLRQEVYVSLAKLYEQARLAEVRNTPVITIVDPPEGFARRAGAGLLASGLLGVVVGGLLGIGLAVGSEFLARQRSAAPAEYAEFLALWRAVFGHLFSLKLRSQQRVPGDEGSRPGE